MTEAETNCLTSETSSLKEETKTDYTLTLDEVMRNQMTYYESKENIDLSILNTIIYNIDDIMQSINIIMKDKKGDHLTTDQIKTLLQKYYTNRKQGKRIIYKFAKNCNRGRLFSQTLSGQGMARQIRHTLFKDNYIDIDIVNCHPVLLSWFCHQKGYKCENLDNYILNRDSILQRLMTDYNESKEDIKSLILCILNGGGRTKVENKYIKDEFIFNFYNEMVEILNNVVKSATEEERNSKEFNVAGSLLNRHLCSIENYVLKKMVDFFETKKYKNLILCFDGLIVHNSAEELIDDLQKSLDTLGIPNLNVIIKPMDEYIDLSKYKSAIIELPKKPLLDDDPNYTINNFIDEFSGRTFVSMVEFKSQVLPKYCKVFAHFRDFISPVYRCPNNEFVYTYPNTDLFHWIVGGQKIGITDIVKHFPMNVPFYDNFDYYPDGFNVLGEECPPSILNVWPGFKAKRLDSYDQNMIQPFIDHILEVWADDDRNILE